MRKILFRGKREDTKRWIFGDLEHDSDGAVQILGTHSAFARSVIPETVGQFTGLTDKNGRRIFEGDIIKNHQGDIGVIQWFEEHSAFMIFCTNQNRIYFLYDNDFKKIKIIGNIHDNPELLEHPQR